MRSAVSLAVSAVTIMSLGVTSQAQKYNQTNLVSSVSGVARVTDPNLVDAWGLARASKNALWVSDNDTGVSSLYNGAGTPNSLVVTIPSVNPKKNPKGAPTGIVPNSSLTDFIIAPGQPANFIFTMLGGGLAAWNPNVAIAQGASAPSTHAVLVAKGAEGSSYTGLTSGFIDNKRYLYAANFAKGRVDVYDSSFHLVQLNEDSNRSYDFDDSRSRERNAPFVDERIPRNFAPFNVQAIGENIVVTFGLRVEGQSTAVGGEGLGYVDVFSSSGRLLTRLEGGSQLNAPWGIVLAPLDFGRFSHSLLVGQFGGGGTTPSAGTIAAYDLATGKYEGQIEDASGKPIVVPGIWGLAPGNISPDNLDAAGSPAAEVYFTARNVGKGLFGYFTAVTTDLIEGSAQ